MMTFRKLNLSIPFLFVFTFNLFITQINGFEFAGRLALFALLSSFFSLFLGMRWDLEILLKKKEYIPNSLQSGLFAVTFLGFLLSSIAYLIDLHSIISFNIYVLILSAILTSIHELFINILLKVGKLTTYILFRSLQPLILFVLCISTNDGPISWFISYVIVTSLLLLFSRGNFRKSHFHFISRAEIQKIFVHKISPTLSSLITNSIPLLWLYLISMNFGERDAGLWINIYRIFNLPTVFLGASILPFLLGIMGEKENVFEKFRSLYNFYSLVLLLMLGTLLISYFFGDKIFSFLTGYDQTLVTDLIIILILLGFMQYSLQYFKEIYQSINKNNFFLSIMVLELIVVISLFSFLSFGGLLSFAYGMLLAVFVPFILCIFSSKKLMCIDK